MAEPTSTEPVRNRRPLLLRLAAVLAALALVAAACGSDDEGSTGDDVETGEDDAGAGSAGDEADEPAAGDAPDDDAADVDAAESDTPDDDAAETGDAGDDAERTASARGVEADTMTIGISMLDFGLLVEQNLSPAGWGDQQLVWQTYIDDINANGGINGRMLEAVYEFYSPLGTTEAEAACLALTADVETFAVLGGFLGPAEPANTCIVGVQDTILVGGRQSIERLEEAEAPWLQTPTLRERNLDVFLDLLDSDGRLQDAKIAIIGALELEDVYNGAEDAVKARGVEPVLAAFNEVAQGDIIAQNDRWQVLAENIRASGADTVLVIGAGQAAMRGISTNGLDVEAWVLDPTGLLNLGENTTPDQADGAITITGLTDQEIWEEEGTQECRAIFSAANPDIVVKSPEEVLEDEEQWFNPIMSYCRWLALFVLVSEAAGVNPTQESFQSAADDLGEFSLPGMPFASLGPGKYDANDSFRLSVFDMDASDSGDLVPLTDVLDGTP